jgi:hypothetical protein
MPINQNQFESWAKELTNEADEITLEALEEIRMITNRWIDDPDLRFEDRWQEFSQENASRWEENSPEILTSITLAGYIRGINNTDKELKQALKSVNDADQPLPMSMLFTSRTSAAEIEISEISINARERLSDGLEKHLQAYGAIEREALDRLENTFRPVLRSQRDIYRQVQAEVLSDAFRTGERTTRRQLAQQIMDDLGRQGITGITYRNGAEVPIDVYSRMVARSAGQNAALQASANRLQERGYDLVRVNQYAGASDLCYPWQGRVYSLSGESDQYPPMDEASFDGTTGLWHPNCGHSYSAYIPGTSKSLGKLSDDPTEQRILDEMGEAKGNEFIYKKRQQQRRYENAIRKAKRRKAVALNKSERERIEQLIRQRQARQRELIENNPFLRRRYASEQI